MRFGPKSLRGKLIFYGALVALVAAALVFYLGFRMVERETRSTLERHMSENAALIISAIETVEDVAVVQAILESFHLAEEGHEVLLVDRDGMVIASSRRESVGQPIEEAVAHAEMGLRTVLEGEAPFATEEMPHRGVRVIDLTLPVHGDPSDRTAVTGALHYVEPYAGYAGLVRRALAGYLLFTLLLLVLLLGPLYLFLSRAVLVPVGQLVASNRAVTEGSGEGMFIPEEAIPDDEIGEVMHTRNAMLSRLEAHARKLVGSDRALESMLDAVVVADADGTIRTVNRAALELLGYAEEELIGRPVGTIFEEEEEEEEAFFRGTGLARLVREGAARDVELTLLAKSGERIPVVFNGSVIREDGHLACVVGVARDMRERRRAEAEIKRRNEELAALNAIAAAVSESLDLDTILNAALQQIVALTGVDGAECHLPDDTGKLALAMTWGLDEAFAVASRDYRFPVGEGIPGRAFARRAPLYVRDAPTDERYWRRDLARAAGYRSLLCVPIVGGHGLETGPSRHSGGARSGDRPQQVLLGTFMLYSRGPREFAPEVQTLLMTVGGQLGVAIERARLYEASQRRAAELATLNDVAETLNRSLDLSQTLDGTLECVLDLLGLTTGWVLLAEQTGGPFQLAAARGLPPALAEDFQRRSDLCNCQRLLLAGELDRAVNILECQRIREAPEDTGGLKVHASVPLSAGDEWLGIIDLASAQEDQFAPDVFPLLTAIANQASVAIERARLFDRVTRRTAELEAANEELTEAQDVMLSLLEDVEQARGELEEYSKTLEERVRERTYELSILYELSQQIGYTLNYDELFRLIMDSLHKVVDYDICGSILLYTEDTGRLIIREAVPTDDVLLGDFKRVLFAGFSEMLGEPTGELVGMILEEEEEEEEGSRIRVRRQLDAEGASSSRARGPSADGVAEVLASLLGDRLRSFFNVPLIVGDQTIGMINISSEREDAFSEDQIRLLYTIANQASVAVQKLQALLAAEMSRLESMVESLTEGLIMFDEQDRLVLINPAAKRMLGHRAEEEITTEHLLEHLQGSELEAFLRQARSLEESPLSREVRLAPLPPQLWEELYSPQDRGDDTPSPQNWGARGAGGPGGLILSATATAVKDAEGNRTGTVVGLRDVTEEKELQAYLMQTDRLASVGTLAAGVAHEINNPLQAIAGRAEMLLAYPDRHLKSEKAGEYVQIIADMTGRLTRIVRGLLSFARREPDHLAPTDLNQALDETLELVGHQLERGRIEVVRDYAAHLPRVMANKGELQQVFMNLMFNARDAMRDGGRLTVSTREEEIGRWGDGEMGRPLNVCISFADTGVGIPAEHRSKLFLPFFTTKEAGKGTGLGLYISYGIIDRHGGRIEVESEEGVGTRFTVVLPVEVGG